MKLRRALRLSVRALLGHRLRTALALASIGMGTTGLLLTSAVGKGAEAEVQRSIAAAGSNLLVVRPAQVKRTAARRTVRGVVTTLRLDDFRAIEALPVIQDAAPVADGALRLTAGRGSMPASVVGTGPALFRIRNFRLRAGRFFDQDEDDAPRRVAVLGARVAHTLFPGQDAVGQEVRVRGQPFEVIGVLVARGVEADGSDQDGNVFIPIRTALRRVFNTTWITGVFVSVEDGQRMREAEAVLRRLLRERHRLRPDAPDDFEVQDQARLLAMKRAAVEGLTLLTAGLAAVALLVGGAGVLALMFLSVKERTAEIGLRMAVGARPRDVLVQFLAEAALLALGGWGAGAAVAVLASVVVRLGTSWPVAPPAEAALASLAMALVTGAGAGAVPARRASRLPPVQALAAS